MVHLIGLGSLALWYIINFIGIGCLIFPFLMVGASFFSGKKKTKGVRIHPQTSKTETDFACVITAYKNLQIAIPAVEALLKQDYQNFFIYLVADDCLPSEVAQLHFPADKVRVLLPPDSLHSKVLSMRHAVAHYVRPHAFTVVFDADNLAQVSFLTTLNSYVLSGYKVVQGRRVAKNLDTVYACADAMGEIYKNYIERYVPYLLGSSATIAGSGMAIETGLFTRFLYSPAITNLLNLGRVVVAEDKMLQNAVLAENEVIAFAKDALLYDEKITTANQVKRQRTRWLYAYFENLPGSLSLMVNGLLRFNTNKLIFGVFSFLPPLFLLLLGAVFMAMLNLVMGLPNLFWAQLAGISIFTGNIFWVLYLSNAPRKIWESLWVLPFFVFNQMLALFQIKRAKHSFMTTEHQQPVSIEGVTAKK